MRKKTSRKPQSHITAMKRKLTLTIEKVPRRALLVISLFSVLLVGISLGAITSQTTVTKPSAYTITIQDGQFTLNQATVLWQANGIALNITNTGPTTATDQVQIVFYNGTSLNPLGTEVYNLQIPPGPQGSFHSVGQWPFQLLDLSTNSRIVITL